MHSIKNGPILSVIVVVREMGPDTLRTLFTLSPEYQSLPASRYEVIVIDTGSTRPPGEETLRGIADNFRYIRQQP